MTALFAYIVVTLVPLFFVGPLLGRQWRERRHLADSTAVQLTRDPDGLSRALVAFTEHGGPIVGPRWSDLLFIVGSEVTSERAQQQWQRVYQERREELKAMTVAERMRKGMEIANQFRAEAAERKAERAAGQNSFPDKLGILGTFHPSINSRMLRLKALGAHVPWQARREFPVWILVAILFIFFGGIFAAALWELCYPLTRTGPLCEEHLHVLDS